MTLILCAIIIQVAVFSPRNEHDLKNDGPAVKKSPF
jgi:hypothetical protein